MAKLTTDYAAFAAAAATAEIPAAALEVARLGFTDVLGVMLAGAGEPVVRRLRAWARSEGGRPAARCVGEAQRLPAPQAALINATAAHALDFDDFAFSNHPSAVLVPAILAAADAGGHPVPGALALRAYVAGYEIWADAFLREPDLYYDKGWHPTSVLGTLGATAAAAVVVGLDERRVAHALALAASQASGVFENFGTMAKPLHGGRASSVGVLSCALAAAGIEASLQAIEGPRGMLLAFSPAGRVDRERALHAAGPWQVLRSRLNLKRFPVVGAAQRGIECMLGWRAEHGPVDATRILDVRVQVSQRHAAVMPFHCPGDALEAKFSLEFALACALLHGQVGLQQLTDACVRDPVLQALMARIRIETTDAFEPGWRDAAPFDQLWVTLEDGRELASPPVRRPLGHADAPMDDHQVRAKFDDCLAFGGVDAAGGARLWSQLSALHTLDDLRHLAWPAAGVPI